MAAARDAYQQFLRAVSQASGLGADERRKLLRAHVSSELLEPLVSAAPSVLRDLSSAGTVSVQLYGAGTAAGVLDCHQGVARTATLRRESGRWVLFVLGELPDGC